MDLCRTPQVMVCDSENLLLTCSDCIRSQGRAEEFEEGGRNLKPSVFKKVITPSDCPSYVHHLYTTKVLCICLRGRGMGRRHLSARSGAFCSSNALEPLLF